MQKLKSLLFLSFLLCVLSTNAQRAMYVDDFENIVGDIPAENTLLGYAQSHGIETLLLYGLHIAHANHDLPNSATNFVLADFISKAKTTYGITAVGATAENGDFFTNVIDAYNNSRTDPLEKFDIYNLEFEYWISSATGPGSYYCTTYLIPNGLSCDEAGAFQFFISTLETMNLLASNNTHTITTEAYVGWPSAAQATTIGANLDKLRLHAYVSDPNTAFDYSEDRLIDFANGTPGLDVSIIFSSEATFMQSWLENNSMVSAENIYTTDWTDGSSGWSNNVNLEGFTYFSYTHLTDVPLPVELSYFRGQQYGGSIHLEWETLSEMNADYFDLERRSDDNNAFTSIGRLRSAGTSSSVTQYQFVDRNPSSGLNYYRLKQVDFDGKFAYSDVVTIDYANSKEGVSIYPTLVEDFIFFNSPREIDQIFIYDTNGRKIETFDGFGDFPSLNVANLNPGVYLLVVQNDLGFETISFVKQN